MLPCPVFHPTKRSLRWIHSGLEIAERELNNEDASCNLIDKGGQCGDKRKEVDETQSHRNSEATGTTWQCQVDATVGSASVVKEGWRSG